MKANLIDCYVTSDAVFYRLDGKIDMASILAHHLNNSETEEMAKERWHTEQHWLADWEHNKPFEGYTKNCTATFDMRSSRFYEKMKHGSQSLQFVRNITVNKIKKAE